MFKFIFKPLITAVANEIKSDPNFTLNFMGPMGPVGIKGDMGAPGPVAHEMYELWKREQMKPDAKIEDFMEWFKEALEK